MHFIMTLSQVHIKYVCHREPPFTLLPPPALPLVLLSSSPSSVFMSFSFKKLDSAYEI